MTRPDRPVAPQFADDPLGEAVVDLSGDPQPDGARLPSLLEPDQGRGDLGERGEIGARLLGARGQGRTLGPIIQDQLFGALGHVLRADSHNA